MNKVKVLKKIDILLEVEIASRFYSKIRLAVEKKKLEKKKKAIDGLYWPRNLIEKQNESELLFRKRGMKTNAKLKSLDIYIVTKKRYNVLKEKEEKLAYIRFSNLRNYFLIKRLQQLSVEEKKRLTIGFAIKETEIDRTIDYKIKKNIVKEWQSIEDGEWVFNGKNGFMTKIPAFFGPLIFSELGMFGGRKITIKDRKEVDSKNNTDDNSISTRFVIELNHRSFYNKVAELTYYNLRKLVDDQGLLKKCKKYMRKYNQVKEGI